MGKWICIHCNELASKNDIFCNACGRPDVIYVDNVGGWHGSGTGNMPDGTECGECSNMECGDCVVWIEHQRQHQNYSHWKCEECGNELEIWLDEVEESHPAEGDGFPYERRHLMWHCTECGCDYENYWETQFGDVGESQIKRKYWG